MTTNQPTTPDGRKIVAHKSLYSLWAGLDYVAYIDGDEDGPYGIGETEADAVADFLSILEDAA